jgi:hypothetical protein
MGYIGAFSASVIALASGTALLIASYQELRGVVVRSASFNLITSSKGGISSAKVVTRISFIEGLSGC